MLLALVVLCNSCSPTDSAVTSTSTAPETTTTTSTAATSTTAPSTTVAPVTTTTSPTTTTTTTTTVSTTATTSPPPTSPPGGTKASVVTRIATDAKVVALTFDAGSDRGFAAEILDTLAAQGIKASFGMTGKWAESNRDLLLRMVNEGHTLINHTYDHPHMETLSTEQRVRQLALAEEIIRESTGTTTKPYFRPPYGSYNNQVLIDVASAGYRYSVMWTVDCLGWKGLPPSEVAARCRNALEPGAILLMHVGAASTDYPALDEILADIARSGYRYGTIKELLP
jgi:peptidoglycan-N-acetylglucosamine deacetylase